MGTPHSVILLIHSKNLFRKLQPKHFSKRVTFEIPYEKFLPFDDKAG